jgi:hypothetical protein
VEHHALAAMARRQALKETAPQLAQLIEDVAHRED